MFDGVPPGLKSDPASTAMLYNRAWHRNLAVVAARLCSLAVCVGTIIRLTVEDHFLMSAIAFYMLSPASMCCCAGLAALCFWLADSANNAKRMLLVTLAGMVWVGISMFQFHSQVERNDGTVRVMFWNVFRGHLGWDSILNSIQCELPGVVVLAETGKPKSAHGFWADHFPDHPHRSSFPRSIMVLSKYPISERTRFHHSENGFFGHVQLDIDGQHLTLMVCDLPSKPYYRRSESVAVITEMASACSDRPALIVGDMNTPVDSVYFDELRKSYRNAFEDGGHGYHATWPMPLPVIAIDHCWVSPHIDVAACKIKWTTHSDHRPIVADLTIRAVDDVSDVECD